MEISNYNKKKIFNDPLYGFISLPYDIIFDLIEHPYFQRLRRIKQLGLTHLVYPGAIHTRFQHAIGAMHLTMIAMDVIRSKGHEITHEEAEATAIGILLHDIGHGPFSHALEYSIVKNFTHEDLSSFIMEKLNQEFKGRLTLAIKIFRNEYPKLFLHQLISSQLDMDRLDYLKRDSFFTGVSEGVINTDRIITMLNVKDNELCVEAKGIYSIEKFIIARTLMYWQVYLHKTVLSAESIIVNILKRAKELALKDVELFCTDSLRYFLYQKETSLQFSISEDLLEQFSQLDDFDITASIKMWKNHPDFVLSSLCKAMIDRKLFKIELGKIPIKKEELTARKKALSEEFKISMEECEYFVFSGSIENNAYNPLKDKINLLYKNGDLIDIADAADQLNIGVLSKSVKKYYLAYPKQEMVNNLKKVLF